jgi:hypothetical protein
MKIRNKLTEQKYKIIGIFFLVPIGFYSKFYNGFAKNWVNNSLGGVFYVMFFAFFFSVIFSKSNVINISIIIGLATSVLEIIQLWKPPFLELVRSNFLGRTLLGNCFTYSDFIYYLIGTILSVICLKFIEKLQTKNTNENSA